jgi:Na+-transporting NADH:ubiquinone oxidoreductase subunit NqrB
VTSAAQVSRSYFRWPGGRRDPRWVMIGIHSTFNVLGQTVLGFKITPLQIVTAVVMAAAWDVGLHRAWYGSWIVPKSGLITGLGIALLLRGPGLYIFAFTAVLAVASKHIIKINGKHVFNPSTFGITMALLFMPGAHFIADQWGRSFAIAFVILNLGMFIVYRVRRFDVVISFALAWFLFNGIWLLSFGYSVNSYWFWQTWHTAVTPAALIFTFFMITDPRTSPATRLGRIIYCVATAGLATLFNYHGQPGLFYGLFLVLMTVPLLDRLLVGRSLHLPLPRLRTQPGTA